MKIDFEDGSFITFDPANHDDRLLTVCMCGLSDNGKKATMSSSTLTHDQVVEIIGFLHQWEKDAEM